MCSLPATAKHHDTGSILCERCSVLAFDDQIFRDFTEEDDISSLPVFPYDGSLLNLELDYEHTDLFPELPGLKASAEAGCAFCAALREATSETTLPNPCHIRFHLRYMWSPPCAQDFGLYMLLANMSIIDDEDESESADEDKSESEDEDGDDDEEQDEVIPIATRSVAFVVESEGKKSKMLCPHLVSKYPRRLP